jgi:hypothetical protein
MKSYFYDIESLENVFTLANFRAEDNQLDIFYLIDDKDKIINEGTIKTLVNELLKVPEYAGKYCDTDTFETLVTKRIYERNRNFDGTVTLYNLEDEQSNIILTGHHILQGSVLYAIPTLIMMKICIRTCSDTTQTIMTRQCLPCISPRYS